MADPTPTPDALDAAVARLRCDIRDASPAKLFPHTSRYVPVAEDDLLLVLDTLAEARRAPCGECADNYEQGIKRGLAAAATIVEAVASVTSGASRDVTLALVSVVSEIRQVNAKALATPVAPPGAGDAGPAGRST